MLIFSNQIQKGHLTQFLNRTVKDNPSKTDSNALLVQILHFDIWKVIMLEVKMLVNVYSSFLSDKCFMKEGGKWPSKLLTVDDFLKWGYRCFL